jgi:hypothetical protein
MKLIMVIAASAIAAQAALTPPYNPQIPKVWDDAMVETMELPLVSPAPRPVHVPSAWYYSIPEIKIFKTYPLEMAGKTRDEYRARLEQQEPEVVFDRSKLKAEADWIEAGRIVFHTSLDPQLVSEMLPANTWPPAQYVIREKGKIERTTGCRECHNGSFDRPPRAPVFRALGDPEARKRFALPWLDPDPNLTLPVLASSAGRGAAIRWGGEPQFPIQVPDLTDIKDRKYLDHTGLNLHRSIGDIMRYAAMATSYGTERYRRYGDFIPAGIEFRDLPDPSTLRRFSDEQLYALALYIYSLEPPPNPNKPSTQSEAGQRVFASQGCPTCHTPPLYTSNKLVPADGFKIPPEHRQMYDILDVPIGLDPLLAMQSRRGTGYYKVPSLKGVWRRPALEHRGSVLTLEEWFDPARLRDDYVPTGSEGPTKTRAVKGHEFGLRLSPDDKAALIAFLKTL